MTALLPFLTRNWKTVAALAIILALAIMLAIAKGDARHWKKQDALHIAERDQANLKLTVSNASIKTLTDALNEKNAESEARSKALAESQLEAVETEARLSKLFASSEAQRAVLKAIAREAEARGDCKVPPTLARAMDGL